MNHNIIMLPNVLDTGGAERVCIILANYFAVNGHNVTLVVNKESEHSYQLNDKINVIVLPYTNNKIIRQIKGVKSLANIIAGTHADTVMTFYTNFFPVIFLSYFYKFRLISSQRNEPAAMFNKHPFKKMLVKKLYKRSTKVVFQLRQQMNYFNEKIKKKGSIIPNPILNTLSEPYKGERRREIVTFCRLHPQKNLKMLIDGFTLFHSEYNSYNLMIYGKGNLKNELNEYIIEKNMSGYIEIKDFTLNIHELIIDSVCYVSTSNYEGLSNAMLESMALGLPVICTDCRGGGAKEYIHTYENGILIPTGDVAALAEALKYVAENPEEARQMGIRASKIRKCLSVDIICKQWMSLLE